MPILRPNLWKPATLAGLLLLSFGTGCPLPKLGENDCDGGNVDTDTDTGEATDTDADSGNEVTGQCDPNTPDCNPGDGMCAPNTNDPDCDPDGQCNPADPNDPDCAEPCDPAEPDCSDGVCDENVPSDPDCPCNDPMDPNCPVQCVTDADCPEGQLCFEGICQVDDTCNPMDPADPDCGDGMCDPDVPARRATR
jgi:Cys-rich repeat protein